MTSNSYSAYCTILDDNFLGMDSFGINTNVTKSVFNIPPHDWVRIRLQVVAYDNFEHSLLLSIDLNSNYNTS